MIITTKFGKVTVTAEGPDAGNFLDEINRLIKGKTTNNDRVRCVATTQDSIVSVLDLDLDMEAARVWAITNLKGITSGSYRSKIKQAAKDISNTKDWVKHSGASNSTRDTQLITVVHANLLLCAFCKNFPGLSSSEYRQYCRNMGVIFESKSSASAYVTAFIRLGWANRVINDESGLIHFSLTALGNNIATFIVNSIRN